MDRRDVDFLTGEALQGELLPEVWARGPLSAEEALLRAIEIGGALHQAHSTGRVHGGLSPWTILIGADGARVLRPPPMPPGAEDSRSAPYRSPEQVRGEAADARSDIFSFGALLYEMMTGRRAFPGMGEELNHQVLNRPPAVPESESPAYAAAERVIAGCLAKDPGCRRQRIQNAVIELKLARRALRPAKAAQPTVGKTDSPLPTGESLREIFSGEPVLIRPSRRNRRRRAIVTSAYAPETRSGWRLWAIATALLGLAVVVLATLLLTPKPPVVPSYTFKLAPPESTTYPGTPAVSPNGRYLAFSAVGPDGRRALWLRPLDAEISAPIPGTEDASEPFWSPDSTQIAFFAGRMLRKVAIRGGPPQAVCAADSRAGGGSWNSDGAILFAPGLSDGLYRLSSSGGEPQPVLVPDRAKAESAFLWPQFLPDGKHFLFYAITDSSDSTGVYAGILGTPARHLLLPSETDAVYSAAPGQKTGYLLFINERTLMAQPFDASQVALKGEATPLWEDVGAQTSLSRAPVSVSATALLVYQPVGRPTRQLVWLDREGKQIAIIGEPGEWRVPRISPDGLLAVAAKLAPNGNSADLWLLGAGQVATKLTDLPMHQGWPVWSPGGTRVAFAMTGKTAGRLDLFTQAVRSGQPQLLFASASDKYPTDWSHDGRYLLFNTISPGLKTDIWALAPRERQSREPRAGAVVETIHSEGEGVLSADGRWLAYQSDESGRNEVYVQLFAGIAAGAQRRWRISEASGGRPRWRSDGKELYFLTNAGRMLAVAVHPNGRNFEFSPPKTLFQMQSIPKVWNDYDVTPDGQRFLVNLPLEVPGSPSFQVVTNWTEKLRQ